MTKDEIRTMFLTAAALRRMPEGSPMREIAAGTLAELEARYEAEVFGPVNGEEPEADVPVWRAALEYVGRLFSIADSDEGEPDHASMSAARKDFWKVISSAVAGKYMNHPAGQGETCPEPEV